MVLEILLSPKLYISLIFFELALKRFRPKSNPWWKDDKMHGQGTHTWPDGKKYVGEFKDGEFIGKK